jgi:thymidylate synthase
MTDKQWLQNKNNHIWDEWMMKDFSVGTAYGWQLAKKCRVVDLGKLNGSELSQYAVIDRCSYDGGEGEVTWYLYQLQR